MTSGAQQGAIASVQHLRRPVTMLHHLSGGWAFAHTLPQKWTAQRAGSRLVGELRDALNAAPERFGRMSGSTHPDGRWTSWGVGLALFVEGY